MIIGIILANVIGAAVMIAVLTASGARVRHWLRLPLGPSDRWSADLVIGAGLFCFWVLPLGLVGFLRPAPLVTGFIVQAVIGRWRGTWRPLRPLMFAAAAGLPNLVIAIGPPHFYDAMVYHLGLPWQALLEGGWSAHPENLFSAFPPLVQMISLPALALDLFRIPGVLHWWAWVCAAVAAGGLARRLGVSCSVGYLVSAAVMLLPVTPLIPGFPAAEGWFLAALIPAASAALLQAHRMSSGSVMMLCLGLAAATRVQGLGWIVVLLTMRLILARNPAFLIRSIGFLLLGSSPWWIKNLALLGDPLAPVFWTREGIDTLWRDGAVLFKVGVAPTELTAPLSNVLSFLTPAILPILAAASLAAVSSRKSRPVFMAAVVGIVLWISTGALPVFFAPSLILLLITISSWGGTQILRVSAIVVLAANIILGLAIHGRWMTVVHPLDIMGKDFVEAATDVAPNPPFAAFRALDEALPPDAKVLLVAEPRIFGFPRPVVAPSQHDQSPLRALCEGDTPPESFADSAHLRGITHLVINHRELIRLGSNYPISPWETARGEDRWLTFVQSLGKPIFVQDEIMAFDL